MKSYTLALAAGVPVDIHIGGAEFFLLDSAPSGGITVDFFGSGNLSRNERIESGIEGTWARVRDGFASLRLTSVAAQNVRFYVARGEVGVNRFSGSSDVTDRAARLLGIANLDPLDARNFLFGDDEVRGGRSFIGTTQPGPVAAQVAIAQLFNPALSGKILYLERMLKVTSVADRLFVKSHNVALVALIMQGANKSIGGAAGVGAVRGGTVAAGAGATIGRTVQAVNAPYTHEFFPPIRIPEGFGVHSESAAVNTAVDVTFEWREEPN